MSCASRGSRIWPIWSILSIWFLLLRDGRADLNNETSPTHQFKSRPDLHAPIVEVTYLDTDLVTPGYVFVAPYRNTDPGPYIYDNYGQLVWSGAGWSGPRVAHTPRVCQYHGEDHLCFFTGQQHQGFSRGHGVIMDKHYRTVKTVEAHGAGASSDMHEFKMTPHSDGKSVLMTVYQPRQYDLTTNPRFNVKDGMGWIVEGVFQEIEIDTNKLLFEWRSLDHIDPSEAWTMPHTTDTSGNGVEEWHPWDYFHLNSVDKNKDGDYLISARHASAIYKVSGKDGSVIWRLGGVRSDFKLTNFAFAYQHHARWLSETASKTVLSFFDNGFNTINKTTDFSHGFIIEIDHVTMKAKKTRQWGAPDRGAGGILAASQGAMQLLDSGNVHIGWGEWAHWSEHTWDGRPVTYAKLARIDSGVMIYRTNKYNWTAEPLTKPALWTFSLFGDKIYERRMGFWVSWNGATEVASWDFYTSDSSTGPWSFVANEEKRGFETAHFSKAYSKWAYASALDRDGNVLGDSMIARTFVPSDTLRPFCGDTGCKPAKEVHEEDKDHTPMGAEVEVDQKYLSTNRGFDTTEYYHGAPFDGSSGAPGYALPPLGDGEVDAQPGDEVNPTQPPADYEQDQDDLQNHNEYLFPVGGPSFDATTSGRVTYTSSSFFILLFGMAMGFVMSVFFNVMRGRMAGGRGWYSVL